MNILETKYSNFISHQRFIISLKSKMDTNTIPLKLCMASQAVTIEQLLRSNEEKGIESSCVHNLQIIPLIC